MDDGIKIHEGAAAIRASMPKQQAAQGLLQCLLELGHGESALLHADGFVARDPSLSQVVAPWQAEAAMSSGGGTRFHSRTSRTVEWRWPPRSLL